MKKFVSIYLSAVLIFLFTIPVYAIDIQNKQNADTISPQFTYILSMSAGLSINSSGKATCSGSVTPYSTSHNSSLTISLQKYSSSGWTTIKSWSDTGEGIIGVNIEGNFYVARGRYRVKSTASIYSSSGDLLETSSFNSTEQIY